MDDAAILASVDGEPDAFGVFYRRHVARLLEYDRRMAADVCAETFAAALLGAHRFDPERGSAASWLDGIARRLVARAERRGRIDDRARRRLGMAQLEFGDDFVRALEEELVEAARFRASRRRQRIGVPRPPLRGVLAGAVALAAVVIVAALALGRGEDERATASPPAAAGCAHNLDPDLVARVAALRNEPRGVDQLPPAAQSVLGSWQLDQVVEDGSRYWGSDGGVDFWVVPAVPLGEAECEPATAACVVAVTRGGRADAECVLEQERRPDAWRLTPLLRGHAAIYGIVPDGVIGVRVTRKGEAAEVEARDNVVGGVLPFGYHSASRVEYVRGDAATKPLVAVVDDGGEPGAVVRRLHGAGYRTVAPPTPGRTWSGESIVYWWPGRATVQEASAVARVAFRGGGELDAINDTARTPQPVLDAGAPIVVVAGE